MNVQGFAETRLDTWKSIAQYLGRSARTVQRWRSEYGLPVRHLGGDATSVFAYTDELDKWLRGRNPSESQEDINLQGSNGSPNGSLPGSEQIVQLRKSAFLYGHSGPSVRRASE